MKVEAEQLGANQYRNLMSVEAMGAPALLDNLAERNTVRFPPAHRLFIYSLSQWCKRYYCRNWENASDYDIHRYR
ncbi:hypothetical protein O9929_13900 [Vibrio lentus]|nr:hypothetical protein [Vibrio lentus]